MPKTTASAELNEGMSKATGLRAITLAAIGIGPAITRIPRRGVLAGRGEEILKQPQDGSLEIRSKVATLKPRAVMNFSQEPEDAKLTGGTRSLMRRLLGLNLGKKVSGKPLAAPEPAKGNRVA